MKTGIVGFAILSTVYLFMALASIRRIAIVSQGGHLDEKRMTTKNRRQLSWKTYGKGKGGKSGKKGKKTKAPTPPPSPVPTGPTPRPTPFPTSNTTSTDPSLSPTTDQPTRVPSPSPQPPPISVKTQRQLKTAD